MACSPLSNALRSFDKLGTFSRREKGKECLLPKKNPPSINELLRSKNSNRRIPINHSSAIGLDLLELKVDGLFELRGSKMLLESTQ